MATLNELRAKAKAYGITGYSQMDKWTLEFHVNGFEQDNPALVRQIKAKQAEDAEKRKAATTIIKTEGDFQHGMTITYADGHVETMRAAVTPASLGLPVKASPEQPQKPAHQEAPTSKPKASKSRKRLTLEQAIDLLGEAETREQITDILNKCTRGTLCELAESEEIHDFCTIYSTKKDEIENIASVLTKRLTAINAGRKCTVKTSSIELVDGLTPLMVKWKVRYNLKHSSDRKPSIAERFAAKAKAQAESSPVENSAATVSQPEQSKPRKLGKIRGLGYELHHSPEEMKIIEDNLAAIWNCESEEEVYKLCLTTTKKTVEAMAYRATSPHTVRMHGMSYTVKYEAALHDGSSGFNFIHASSYSIERYAHIFARDMFFHRELWIDDQIKAWCPRRPEEYEEALKKFIRYSVLDLPRGWKGYETYDDDEPYTPDYEANEAVLQDTPEQEYSGGYPLPVASARPEAQPAAVEETASTNYSDRPEDIDEVYSDYAGDNSQPEQDIPEGLTGYARTGLTAEVVAFFEACIKNESLGYYRNGSSHSFNDITHPSVHIYSSVDKAYYLHDNPYQCYIDDLHEAIRPVSGINRHTHNAVATLLTHKEEEYRVTGKMPVVHEEAVPSEFCGRNAGTFTYTYRKDNQKHTMTFSVSVFEDTTPRITLLRARTIGRMLQLVDEEGETAARYSPYIDTFQLAEKFKPVIWGISRNASNMFEKQFRKALDTFLQAAGLLDESGNLIPDGSEETREQYNRHYCTGYTAYKPAIKPEVSKPAPKEGVSEVYKPEPLTSAHHFAFKWDIDRMNSGIKTREEYFTNTGGTPEEEYRTRLIRSADDMLGIHIPETFTLQQTAKAYADRVAYIVSSYPPEPDFKEAWEKTQQAAPVAEPESKSEPEYIEFQPGSTYTTRYGNRSLLILKRYINRDGHYCVNYVDVTNTSFESAGLVDTKHHITTFHIWHEHDDHNRPCECSGYSDPHSIGPARFFATAVKSTLAQRIEGINGDIQDIAARMGISFSNEENPDEDFHRFEVGVTYKTYNCGNAEFYTVQSKEGNSITVKNDKTGEEITAEIENHTYGEGVTIPAASIMRPIALFLDANSPFNYDDMPLHLIDFYGGRCFHDIQAEHYNEWMLKLCGTSERLEALLLTTNSKSTLWWAANVTGAIGDNSTRAFFDGHDEDFFRRLCVAHLFPESAKAEPPAPESTPKPAPEAVPAAQTARKPHRTRKSRCGGGRQLTFGFEEDKEHEQLTLPLEGIAAPVKKKTRGVSNPRRRSARRSKYDGSRQIAIAFEAEPDVQLVIPFVGEVPGGAVEQGKAA